jgi:hypothetical protein
VIEIITGMERRLMEFRKILIVTAGAAALIASTAMGAVAQTAPSDNTDVDIAVTSTGVLSVQVEETNAFDDIEYSFSEQTVNGTLRVTITDERGTAEGWTFNLRADDFTGTPAGPGDSFPVNGLSLTYDGISVVAGNSNTSGISGSGIGSVSGTGQQIADANNGYGNGQYRMRYPGQLTIPGDTLVDTYTSTVTVEAVSAPQ